MMVIMLKDEFRQAVMSHDVGKHYNISVKPFIIHGNYFGRGFAVWWYTPNTIA